MFKTFFSRTKPHEDNLDYSIPGYDKEGHKNFYGLELAYIESLRIVPYFYFLLQYDHSEEEPEDATQDYTYNSHYFGLGVSGETPSELTNLDWWLEVIKEQGKSYTDAPSVNLEESNIDAWAGVIGCEYKKHFFLNPYLDLNPSFELEYAYGSGDKDRTSVTNTDGGNLNGGDKNFLYYGYYFAGYALNPRLSNIHIYRIGLSINPLMNNETREKFALGTKFYIYRKDKEAGGIYDTDASKVSKDIGKEINFYFYWNVTPKVTWGARYGRFFAGHAYADATDDDSQYAYTNFTISF
jgi:hypothetical protein